MNIRRLLRPWRRFLVTEPKVQVHWPEEPLDHPVEERGGFYNVSLGTTLNSRYKIVRKLGWGQHSSVWLAKDIRYVTVHSLRLCANRSDKCPATFGRKGCINTSR
jgi:hypothetical protein